jgi:hypothetical protein
MPPTCPPAPPPLARIVPGTGGGVGTRSMIVPIEGACRLDVGVLTAHYTDVEGEVVSVPVSGPIPVPAEGSVLTCVAPGGGEKGEGRRQLVTSVGGGGGKKIGFEKGVGRGPTAPPSVLIIMVDSMSREQALRYVIDPINGICSLSPHGQFFLAQRAAWDSAALPNQQQRNIFPPLLRP